MIIIYFAHICTVYVGLAQARPNNNIWIANVCTVYVGLAQARPNNIWIANVCSVYVGLAQARPNYRLSTVLVSIADLVNDTFLARFQIQRGRTDQRSVNQPEMLTFDSL